MALPIPLMPGSYTIPGNYTVQVQAPGGSPASFVITITAPVVAPPPPVPTSITLTPASVSLPDNSPIVTPLGTVAVSMSDGSPFAGTFAVSPSGTVGISGGSNIVLTRGLAASDDGAHSYTITATQNLVSAQATFALNVTASAAPPSIQINGSTSPVTVSAGATISARVANGSGDPGAWLGVYAPGSPSGPGNPASWKWLSTDDARGSIPPAPGVTTGTVHLVVPTQAGQYEVRFFSNSSFTVGATSAAITVQTAAPPPPTPVITVNPIQPQIPDTTAKGAVVATYTVKMSDGSPFAGTVKFGPPNGDAGGIFALSGASISGGVATGQIIVSPTGPGVGPNVGTVTDHITLVATQ